MVVVRNLSCGCLFFILLMHCISAKSSVQKSTRLQKRQSQSERAFDARTKVAQSVIEEVDNILGSGVFGDFWKKSLQLALYEQEVEDINAEHRAKRFMERRLIVMPLSDTFQTNKADPMFGKIQYGDKCSLPSSLGKQIFEQRYEVPWLFEMKPIRSIESNFAPHRLKLKSSIRMDRTEAAEKFDSALRRTKPRLEVGYISPLDFRAPENYIFLPKWIMNDMDLKPFDLVDISMVKMKLASLVKLQPLSLGWDTLVKNGKRNPQSLLEHELNKYSSLTAGTTIGISVDGEEYKFFVKDTIAEGGISVHAVRVQDSDIRADIDRSILDKFIEEDKKLKEIEDNTEINPSTNEKTIAKKKRKNKTNKQANLEK